MNETHGREVLYPIDSLDGVGPEHAKQLSKYAVRSVEELLSLSSSRLWVLADSVPGISAAQLRQSLLPQARFMLVRDIDEIVAKAIARCGYRHYEDLMVARPSLVHECLVEHLGDAAPSLDEVPQLQLAAAREMNQGLVIFHVLDGDTGQHVGSPRLVLSGTGFSLGTSAVVRHGDESGWVVSPRLQRDRIHRGILQASGYRRQSVRVVFDKQSVQVQIVLLEAGEDQPSVDEFEGQQLGLLTGREIMSVDRVSDPSDLPVGTPFFVGRFSEDGTKAELVSLRRRLYGNVLSMPSLEVPLASLPGRIGQRDLVTLGDNATFSKMSKRKADALLEERGPWVSQLSERGGPR